LLLTASKFLSGLVVDAVVSRRTVTLRINTLTTLQQVSAKRQTTTKEVKSVYQDSTNNCEEGFVHLSSTPSAWVLAA